MTICTCMNCGYANLVDEFLTDFDELICPNCGCDDISSMTDEVF